MEGISETCTVIENILNRFNNNFEESTINSDLERLSSKKI